MDIVKGVVLKHQTTAEPLKPDNSTSTIVLLDTLTESIFHGNFLFFSNGHQGSVRSALLVYPPTQQTSSETPLTGPAHPATPSKLKSHVNYSYLRQKSYISLRFFV